MANPGQEITNENPVDINVNDKSPKCYERFRRGNGKKKLSSENRCECSSFSEEIVNFKCKMLGCQFLFPC